MILQQKTLERLRVLINEETEYRSGPKLVDFFNRLGFRDQYVQGFPSRWIFTDQKLAEINGKPELDKCIKMLFAPVNFVGRFNQLDGFINDFNQYLAFDGWRVVRNGKELTFKKADTIDFNSSGPGDNNDEHFLNKEFGELRIDLIGLNAEMREVVDQRIGEIKSCLQHKAPLAMIFLAGSTLEGLLLDLACKHPREFNTSNASPKDQLGKVRPIPEWSLNSLIDVAHELGFIGKDVKKFSHALQDFRNYIHPNQQVLNKFTPDEHTAKICWQVFQAVVADLSKPVV